MNKRILAVIVVVLMVAAAVATGAITRASTGDKIAGDTFETSVGRTFTLVLDANATTGFSWTQTIKDTAVVAYVDHVYMPTAHDPLIIGGGGTDTFTFKAVGRGTTTITLVYARPWESVPPAQTRTIVVTVR